MVVRLLLLHHFHRRRSEAARQDDHPVELWAIIVPGVFMVLVAIGLYRLVDFNFLSAAAWVDNNGGSTATPCRSAPTSWAWPRW